MKKLIFIFVIFISSLTLSQEFSFTRLPLEFTQELVNGKIVTRPYSDFDTLEIYYAFTHSGIYTSRSFDRGKNWSSPVYVGFWNQFDILQTADNKKVLSELSLGKLNIITFGISADTVFLVGNGASNLQVRKSGNGAAVFYSRLNRVYGFISTDLLTWSSIGFSIYSDIKSFQLLKLQNEKYLLVFTRPSDTNLYYTFSDDLINWQSPQILLTGIDDSLKFSAEQNQAGVVLIAVEKKVATPFTGLMQKDIFITTSVDNGNTWSSFTSLTKFKGDDNLLSISDFNDKFILLYSSKRGISFTDYYFGLLPAASDKFTPPAIYEITQTGDFINGEVLKFFAKIDDDEPLKYVRLKIKVNNESTQEIEMNDKGVNGDEKKFDKIYSALLNRKLVSGDLLNYSVVTEDLSGNKSVSESGKISIPIDYQMRSYSMMNNRFQLSFDNNGNIADVTPNNYGNFDSGRVLFCGGFLLSGFENDNLFANAVFYASRIVDYYPGIVGGSKEDPKNQIYIISRDDPPFSDSWQLYKYATLLNAPFYDGDFDGVYNPVDKNNNGKWDEDEDAPEILGDLTTWCVFNDAVPSYLRAVPINPLGIEIQQSIFSFNENENNQPDEKIYIRHRLINRGTVSEVLDSVIYSFFIDPDIGQEYFNDYVSTDTTLNLVYSYSGRETDFGNNPPASGVAILQGPPVFIPGKTFIDNNSDKIFQPEIDIAIDTAVLKNGSGISAKKIPGAMNGNITASYTFLYGSSNPTVSIFRYNQQGLNNYGQFINPCSDMWGTVFGSYNCNEINPIFHYSGNPVIPDGWVMTIPNDIRYLISVGKFQLKKDEPVDIWGVYVAGRGVDSLDSITELKKNVQSAKKFYDEFPINPERKPPVIILPNEYVLYQNYPNPFNSGTKIKFEIPSRENVKLKLYDVTGREVATLLNETKPAGIYEVLLTSENLSSGVYFYQIIAGNYISTKKCVVLK